MRARRRDRIAADAGTRGRLSTILALVGVLLAAATAPAPAFAHGPVAPLASSYLARINAVPSGLEAKVVDADQRMWLRVPAGETVVVLDYGGAPYLRFSPRGVQMNRNSAMYYLNQTPIAQAPPSGLRATTPPSWQQASRANQYGWHDGRLHALATIARAPGVAFIGHWRVPLLVGGHPSAISGGLWHSPNPSLVWFWPIMVLLSCVLAARRLRRPELDGRVARVLAIAALLAFATAAVGRQLHGRPAGSALELVELALMLAFVAWGLRRVLWQRPGYLSYFVISFAALWQGLELIPTLTHGYVLIAVPAFAARACAVVCLGCGAGLLLLVLRLAERPDAVAREKQLDQLEGEDDTSWELV